MKVRANVTYIYYPNLMDRCSPAQHVALVAGDIVKVICMASRRRTTMGQCYVELNGKFAGMVSTNSLYPMSDVQIVVDAIKADMETLKAVQS